jgi:subtilisin family serine protease
VARIPLLLAAALLLPAASAFLLPAGAALPPPAPPGEGPHGEAPVVVAVIDTGINPYHAEFRDPARVAHPSSYLQGYPAGARALHLCLDAHAHPNCASYAGAKAHDAALWRGVPGTEDSAEGWGPLHWIPGTRIVGAVSIGSPHDSFIAPTRILDETGHGTAAASLAVGSTLGLCPSCLLVVVEGPGDEALAWAAAQPWIDVVSNSWGWQSNLGWPPPPFGVHRVALTRGMVEAGKTVLFSAGNGLGFDTIPGVTDMGEYLAPGESTFTSEYTGPDWIVTVGALDPENGHPIAGSGRPVDVAAAGLDVRAASAWARSGTLDFSGTSASAPIVAGAFGHILQEARIALGDARAGPRTVAGDDEVLAQGAPLPAAAAGPLADGLLTRSELQALVFGAARPCLADPVLAQACEGARAPWPFPGRAWGWSLPTPPVAWPLLVGHGGVDLVSRDAAVRALLGQEPLAPKPAAELWSVSDSWLRQRLWGFWEHGATAGDLLEAGAAAGNLDG